MERYSAWPLPLPYRKKDGRCCLTHLGSALKMSCDGRSFVLSWSGRNSPLKLPRLCHSLDRIRVREETSRSFMMVQKGVGLIGYGELCLRPNLAARISRF
jgi:hypothetical protein